MRKELQDILDRALADMCREIDPDNGLLRMLLSEGVLNPDQIESCENKLTATRADRVDKMVRYLKLRDDSAYEKFIKILCRVGYQQFVNEHLPSAEGAGSKPKAKTCDRKRKAAKADTQHSTEKHRRCDEQKAEPPMIVETIKYLEALSRQTVAYPSHWTSRDSIQSSTIWRDGTGKMEHLSSSTEIYQEVKKLVTDTWTPNLVGKGADAVGLSHSSIVVKQIWRIENPLLYDKYQKKKNEMCHTAAEAYKAAQRFPTIETLDTHEVKTGALDVPFLKSFLVSEINEFFLFHGTKTNTRDIITNQGLDSRVASSAYFGKGIYFAESSTKSDQYADNKSRRTPPGTPLYMFVVRVLLGNPYRAVKPRAYKRAPCTHAGCNSDLCTIHPVMHDSVVGVNRQDGTRLLFREFVVYDGSQSYPEYLVEYIRQ